MNTKVLSLILMSCVAGLVSAAEKCWWEGPSLRATVNTCPTLTENNQVPAPHYINVSADGSLLLVDNSCQLWDYSHPVQLYRVGDILSKSGTVEGGDFAIASQGAKDIFAATTQDKTATGPGGWKGGAVCNGVALVGSGRTSAQHFASFSTSPADGTWVENASAFEVEAGSFGFDGPDFNADGSALYTNDGTTKNLIHKWTCADFLAAGAQLAESASYPTSVKRVRSVNVYTAGGADLLFYGEGAPDGTHAAKVYVWDTTADAEAAETLLVDCTAVLTESTKDIMNVKVSGLGSGTPYLYVGTDGGELLVYALAADGKSVTSATPVKAFSKAQVCAMCGRKELTGFRAFDVTPDGKTAFFALNAKSGTEPQGMFTVIGYKSTIAGARLPQDGLVVHLDASDRSSFTLAADGRVLSWRSQVNDLAFVPPTAGDTTHIPYYTDEIPVPSTAKVPGVVFGFEPGHVLAGTSADLPYRLRTSLKSSKEVTSKQVLLVVVSLNGSVGWAKPSVDGETLYGADGQFFRDGAGGNMALYGNWWSAGVANACGYYGKTGKVWLDNAVAVDWPNGVYRTHNSYFGFSYVEKVVHVLDGVGGSEETLTHVGYPMLSSDDLRYCVAMEICEVAIYDRELTAAERAAADAALIDKWSTKSAKRVWTGAGATAKWNDVGNWSGYAVPATGEKAFLSGLAVTVEGNVDTSAKIDLNGATLTVGGITGGILVTNTAFDIATLIVTNEAPAKLDAAVCGKIAVEKHGTGTLDVAAFQSYSEGTTLAGGTFAAVTNVAIDAMAGLTTHLDASRADTVVTNAAGDVLEWRSTDPSGVLYKPGWILHPDIKTTHNGPAKFVLDQDKNPAVDFGYTVEDAEGNNVITGCFLQASAKVDNQTLFFVTRQRSSYNGSLWGDYSTYNYRIYRSNTDGGYNWLGASFISGRPTSEGIGQHFAAKDTAPHLLVVCRGSKASSDGTLGVANATAATSVPQWHWGQCTIMEVVVFNRSLTDDEIAQVSASLMTKWNIAPEKACTIGDTLAASPYALTGDATLDFGGMAQTIPEVKLDAGTSSVYPILTFVGIPGALDLTETALTLVSETPVERSQGLLLAPDATVAGPFAAVNGLSGSAKIAYRAHKVGYSFGGLLILLK